MFLLLTHSDLLVKRNHIKQKHIICKIFLNYVLALY
jgi:hypothetical protein